MTYGFDISRLRSKIIFDDDTKIVHQEDVDEGVEWRLLGHVGICDLNPSHITSSQEEPNRWGDGTSTVPH